MTVQHALQRLRHQGLIVSWQGRGSFIREDPDIAAKAAQAGGNTIEANATAGSDEDTYTQLSAQLDTLTAALRQIDDRLSQVEHHLDITTD